MQLYVIRHAIAEDAEPGQPDASRALTRDGTRKAKAAIKGLRALGIELDRVITSPWQRARETTALLAPIADGKVVISELLTQSPRAELLSLIAEHDGSTGVVGHEPWLGELVAWLAFGDTRHGDAIAMKKAGVAWLEGSPVPGGMELRGLLPPSVTRSLR